MCFAGHTDKEVIIPEQRPVDGNLVPADCEFSVEDNGKLFLFFLSCFIVFVVVVLLLLLLLFLLVGRVCIRACIYLCMYVCIYSMHLLVSASTSVFLMHLLCEPCQL